MADADVEKVWTEFWWPTMKAAILERDGVEVGGHTEDGCWVVSLRVLEQLKRELFDFHTVIQTVPAVYSHATGGAMSKATYNDVSQITGCIDENYAEIERDHVADAIKGAREEFHVATGTTADVLLDEFVESLRSYFNIDPKDLA